MRDYNLVVPRDCTVSNTPAENDAALRLMRKFLKAKTPLGKEVQFPRQSSRPKRKSP
jgi:hypothetical protein